MFKRRACVLLLSLCSAAAGAADAPYRPAFHPGEHKGPPAGRFNDVMVLATPHLSQLPKTFEPAQLQPLLERLAAWMPDAIATENLSGRQCDFLRRNPLRYAETAQTYCFDTTAAQAATGMDVPAASGEAERLLAALPKDATPSQRRHLAAILLAAGEPGSAQVQWLRLQVSERHAGDGLTPALVQTLNAHGVRRQETYQLAAVLAARLGHDRLWAVDDHTADSPTPPEQADASRKVMEAVWDNPSVQAMRDADTPLYAALAAPDGVLALYRAYNRPEWAELAYRADFGAALRDPSPEAFGRNYLGYWETRNLRMVANIRDVLGQHPGTRLLAIVGASHKGYYEAYLDQMHDVRLLDVEPVLR